MPAKQRYMDKTVIVDAIQDTIVARNCFIVEINVSKDNDVEIIIESETSDVTLEDCETVSRKFEECFDREKEDYSITVSSAGLDRPFTVLKQYIKAVGSKVDVLIKGGRKFTAELTAADSEGITLKYEARENVEGRKSKVLVSHEDRFSMDQVNAVYPHIDFE